MDFWNALRWAHIAAGVISFIVAPVALAAAKGGATHRRWGMVYFVGMTFATLSATVLAATSENVFFTFVGIFSFYVGFSGFRAIGRRFRIRWFDWFAAIGTCAAMFAMIGYGGTRLVTDGVFFLPLVVFGLVGLLIVGRDLRDLYSPSPDKNAWFFSHMIGMLSSATAAMSAFSVTNLRFLPPPLRILWPACVSIPILIIWIRWYRRKLSEGKSLAQLVSVPEKVK